MTQTKMIEGKKIPIVYCEEVERQGVPSWRFYCVFCKRYHYHGEGEGHRYAHCHKKASPYNRWGYWIVKIRDKEE